MPEIAKLLIMIGAVLLAAGLVLLFLPKLPFLGKLPGDIVIKRENFTLYFPLATSIVISVVASLILWIIGKLR